MSEKTAVEKLFETFEASREDFISGYGGTKAAARRGRKALQEIRQLAKDARDELLAISKEEAETVEIEFSSEA